MYRKQKVNTEKKCVKNMNRMLTRKKGLHGHFLQMIMKKVDKSKTLQWFTTGTLKRRNLRFGFCCTRARYLN